MPGNEAKTRTTALLAEGRSGLLRILEDFALGQGHVERATLDAMRSATEQHHDKCAGLIDGDDVGQTQRLTASQITLIDDEALGFTLRLSKFARHVKTRCEDVLGPLQLRYMSLLECNDTTLQIPIGPETVCHALQALADAAALCPVERLHLVDQCEQLLIADLHTFYASFDERLASSGVTLKAFGRPVVIPSKGPGAAAQPRESANQTVSTIADLPASGLNRLQQALMSRHAQANPQGNSKGNSAGDSHATALAPELAASIMAQVSAWLSRQQQSGAGITPQLASTQLAHLLAPRTAVAVEALEQVFACLAKNAEVPHAIRHTIARLHLPLLKRALHQEQLLSDPLHPAQQLIDALGAAGNTLPLTQAAHPGYVQVDAIVCGALDDGELTDTALDTALSELQAFTKERHHRATSCAERAVDTAGKAERREIARLLASRALSLFLDARTAPAVHNFLTTHWIQVLVHTLYRLGDKHPDWRAQLEVAHELILSAQVDASASLPSEQVDNLPALVARIEAALASIGFDCNARQQALAECAALHAALIAGQPPPSTASDAAAPLVLSSASNDETLTMLHHAGYSAPKSGAVAPLSDVKVGTWVELECPQGGPVHGLLAWIGPAHKAALIATPDNGKVLVVTMRAIAELMFAQRFRVRNVASLTEAMAGSVLNDLKG